MADILHDGAGRAPRPAAGPMAGRGAGVLRLTRRGRVLVLVVLSALLLGAFSIGRLSSRAAAAPPAATHAVVVHAGDTLWSIARQVAPNDDPRVVVARIAALNRLPSVSVRVGERLIVPGG